MVTAVLGQEHLGWKQDGEWLGLAEYVAAHMVTDLPCNLLTCLMSAMDLKGIYKLSHPLKVELFLKHLGRSDADIALVLSELKVRTRQKKDEKDEKKQAAGEHDKELAEDSFKQPKSYFCFSCLTRSWNEVSTMAGSIKAFFSRNKKPGFH